MKPSGSGDGSAGLKLEATQITDAGAAHLGSLARLEVLDLNRAQQSDASLEHLATLTRLECLELTGTEVSEAGLADLRSKLPNLVTFP
jgi:hypothetical protein